MTSELIGRLDRLYQEIATGQTNAKAVKVRLDRATAALVAIQGWPGDLVDNPAFIGSPNPREIAADALEAIQCL